ncbi:Mitochondrial protein import protein ZIM17 AltName: Full=Hsp70-interacting protein in mitochondria; Flags: Precursor [Cyberlindnera jadinii]|uniref:DNL-type domain-containing protein n=1 Tax=Cyberlindnera jadinii (strain ATCC 18201 / CBS 1600 / BCRC 20928 / JCM 3617 / NBRC 0987 / NRRL Y-1542) TaxID=983966 RepID=A0A0H5C9F2_CYBJN|nr:Mitochondrial protein import protein ZIM17 AltName: Full=Hsp70-interacting protein in mitochondria; Flags: Precursor [Cyberlindnera jadinii]
MFRRVVIRQLLRSDPRALVPAGSTVSPLGLRWSLPLASHVSNRYQSSSTDGSSAKLKIDEPQMMIAFTCKKCDTRSSHVMSKQAYTKGTVLITCPGCKGRHLIADHLKIFSDDRITIQDILSAKGESVSQNTDDLVFDDIPDKLKSLIGHHAKDAPENLKKEQSHDEPHSLPEGAREDGNK